MDLRLTTSVLLASSLALAQTPTHISPTAAATTLGYHYDDKPFGHPLIAYQQVHSRNSFNNPSPTLVTQMRMRMPSFFANRPGAMIDLELFMAASPHDASAASFLYANNVVGSEVNVFTRKLILLPTVPDHSWAVAPFPFDTPFPFLATHLSWRALVYGNSRGNTQLLYFLNAWSPSLLSAPVGLGCRAANATSPADHTLSGGGIGATAYYLGYCYIATGGLPALLTIGNSNKDFQGVPLPFDLAQAGAPGCSLYNNWTTVFATATTTDPIGTATFIVPIPVEPALADTTHYSQMIFLSPGANALGLFTSNGRVNTIGAYVGITSIYSIGNTGAIGGLRSEQSGIAIGLN